jgi:hypothetical protein
MKVISTSISFMIQPHNMADAQYVGQYIDFSANVISGKRSFNMGFGSWSVALKILDGSWEQRILEQSVREGDWIEFRLTREDGTSSRFVGTVLDNQKIRSINASNGSQSHVYALNGYGWARALSTPVLSGAALKAKAAVAVPRADGTVTDTEGSPQIPGMVTIDRWTEIMSEVWTAAFKMNGGGVGPAMKKLIQILMNDTWKNPLGEALVDRLVWHRFGTPVIKGIPWRIMELTMAGNLLTPDSILRQIGNESYNEIFYDYDENWNPAIVFRPRPYEIPDKNKPMAFEVPTDMLTNVNTTKSGMERYNYFRSNAALMSFHGIEILIDNADGQSPIIDRDSVERYGLRPIMPQDDFFPPMDKKTNMLSFYIERIRRYYSWYFNNPEYVTGSVTMKGIHPTARLGTYIKVPEKYYWNKNRGRADWLKAYLVAIDESFSVHPNSQKIEAATTMTFVRGEPEGGLTVKEPESWVSLVPTESTDLWGPDYASEHILWTDLACKTTPATPVPEELKAKMRTAASFVEVIMQSLGATTVTIVSGYRTQAYQDALPAPKAKYSQHTQGTAIDFSLPGFSITDISNKIQALRALGQIPQGWTQNYPTFVHYDIRGYTVTSENDL